MHAIHWKSHTSPTRILLADIRTAIDVIRDSNELFFILRKSYLMEFSNFNLK